MTIAALAGLRVRLAGLMLLLGAHPGQAARLPVLIDPSTTQIAYTVFALNLFPVQAAFERFEGNLSADPDDPGACEVHVLVQVASLRMADAARTAQALGPAMLDARRFPTMRFDGRCTVAGVSGTLTLHGISAPLRLSKRREGAFVVCTGTLQRQHFGVSGMPFLIGARVQLKFSTHLPAALVRPEKPAAPTRPAGPGHLATHVYDDGLRD